MKETYLAIRAALELALGTVHIRIWNNQLRFIEEQTQIPFPFPALFVEFMDIRPESVGNGVQNLDLIVRFHICDDFYNGSDQEENLRIFDLKQAVFQNVTNKKFGNSSPFLRVSEVADYEHSNIYHYLQDYSIRIIDCDGSRPINGQEVTVNPLVINKMIVNTL